MAAIRELVMVGEDGEVRLATHVEPGEYSVLLFKRSDPASDSSDVADQGEWSGDVAPPRGKLTLPTLDLSGWPADSKFTREEIYRDDDDE